MNSKAKFIAQGGIIAALYVVLTMISSAMGLASGVIQVRISEALCILPLFTPAAIPGLFIGCLLSNTLSGCVIWDILFGSLATLIGAVGTYMLRKFADNVPKTAIAALPTVIANMLIVPFVLRYAYGAEDAIWFMMLTVGAGEVIACVILGTLLSVGLKKANVNKILA